MADAERLLKVAADSARFDGWNDALSMIIRQTNSRYSARALSDEELGMVAGGVQVSDEMKRKLKGLGSNGSQF